MRIFLAIITLILISLSGCSSTDGKYVKGTGTIIHLEFEGGFYGIAADDSVCYDPSNLPKYLEQDGMRVRFIGKINGGCSYHMWGIGIVLTYIEKLKLHEQFKK